MCTALRESLLAQAPCRPLPSATLNDTVPLKIAQKGIVSDNALNDEHWKADFHYYSGAVLITDMCACNMSLRVP